MRTRKQEIVTHILYFIVDKQHPNMADRMGTDWENVAKDSNKKQCNIWPMTYLFLLWKDYMLHNSVFFHHLFHSHFIHGHEFVADCKHNHFNTHTYCITKSLESHMIMFDEKNATSMLHLGLHLNNHWQWRLLKLWNIEIFHWSKGLCQPSTSELSWSSFRVRECFSDYYCHWLNVI